MMPACAPLIALAIALPPQQPLDATPAYKAQTQIRRSAENAIAPHDGRRLAEREVHALLEAACDQYGVGGSERDALIAAGLRISWRESRWNPQARNGQYLGLFQFGAAWGTEAQRLDPAWSCRRFVKVYAEAGWRGIRRHWAATW